jgi:hypothetical protein
MNPPDPAAGRRYLTQGVTLEQRNVRAAFAEELRYAPSSGGEG